MPSFLRNGSNKEALINLLERVIKEDRSELNDKTVYFSNASHCIKITQQESTIIPEMTSDHEEADTKLIALVSKKIKN